MDPKYTYIYRYEYVIRFIRLKIRTSGGSEPSGSKKKAENFLRSLDYQLIRKYSAPWN
jgi:hypothetical protein